jgi:hypothetical protein
MIKKISSQQDLDKAVELLEQFLLETVYKDHTTGNINAMHLGRLVHLVMHGHYAWLAEIDGEAVGLLLAVREKNLWLPTVNEMRELVWYVKPEHRSGPIAGRLFLEYCRCAEKLLEEDKIDAFFTTRMPTTEQINLERRGFKLVEQTYLKD